MDYLTFCCWVTIVTSGGGNREVAYEGKPVTYWIEQLAGQDKDSRLAAAEAFQALGPRAVPALLEALNDRRVRYVVLGTFVRIGFEAVPSLMEALKDQGKTRNAARALQEIVRSSDVGGSAKGVVPFLIQALNDGNRVVRSSAVALLAKIGPEAKAAVPPLVKRLNEITESIRQHERIRREVIFSLGSMGSEAKDAIPAIIEILEASEAKPRDSLVGALALENIGTGATEYIPDFIEALEFSENRTLRIVAARVLGRNGPKAREAVPVLVGLLKEKSQDDIRELRIEAVIALGLIGKERELAVPALLEATKDKDVEGLAARIALGEFEGQKKPSIALLMDASEKAWMQLSQGSSSLGLFAANLLGKRGHEARAAVPALRRLLDYTGSPHGGPGIDAYPIVRRSVEEAIKKISGEDNTSPPSPEGR